jgi:hypothetical protein
VTSRRVPRPMLRLGWSQALAMSESLLPHDRPPAVGGTASPTIDGTAGQLAGHTAHADLARKARSEFRQHSRMPAWCLPRNTQQRRQNPKAVLTRSDAVIFPDRDDGPMPQEAALCPRAAGGGRP